MLRVLPLGRIAWLLPRLLPRLLVLALWWVLALRGLALWVLALCVGLLGIALLLPWLLVLAGRLLRCPGCLARVWLLGLGGRPGAGYVRLGRVDGGLWLGHRQLRRVHSGSGFCPVGGYAFGRLAG